MKSKILAGLFGGLLATGAVYADDKKTEVAPGTPVTITVTTPSTDPDVSLSLGQRSAKVIPTRCGCAYSGGGNITVAQPSADTITITLTGSAVCTAGPFSDASVSLDYDLSQCFEVSFDNPEVKAAKLVMDATVIGVLRAEKKGMAEVGEGCISLGCATGQAASVCTPGHSVSDCQSLSVNDVEGPVCVPVLPGKYTANATWHVGASMPKGVCPCKGPSAEFAPDAVDPTKLHGKAAFYGIDKAPFGLILTIKVVKVDVPEAPKANGNGNGEKK